MGTGGLKPRLQGAAPRGLWRAVRQIYWSAPVNAVRRLAATATVVRRRRDLQDLKTVLLFIGYPRSGHSLVGSLLSAHPDVVVAHELHALWYRDRGFTLSQIIGLMLRRDRWFERHNRQWTEYNYSVPGQWQGRYRRLQVIGDKKGDGVTDLVHRYPGLLADLQRDIRVAGMQLKIIHTVRNPYDNIATMHRRTGDDLAYVIERHRKRLALNRSILEAFPAEATCTIRHEALIDDPADTITGLLIHLDLPIPEGYLEACTGILYPSPHRSRDDVAWNAQHIRDVERLIAEIPFLEGYDGVG